MSSSKVSKARILCDENLPVKVIDSLMEEGYDVKKPDSKSPDEEVAALAKRDERILVTFDRIFGNTLVFPPEDYEGIVLVRIRPPLITTVLAALSNLLRTVAIKEFRGRLFTLAPFGFKVYPRSAKYSGWIRFSNGEKR